MKIYHTETQEDYDAFREYIKGKGLEYLRSDTKRMEYEDSCNTKYFGVFRCVESCDLDWFEEHFPETPIQKYKAKQDNYKEDEYHCLPKEEVTKRLNDVVNSPNHYRQGGGINEIKK